MGYTIKQKIEICLQSDANPSMTQIDLAKWAMEKYKSASPPSQTTISRILSSKNEILGSKESDFQLVRRRKVSNPLLRFVLTEWMTQAHWERIPVTTPIIQSTANAIWNKLPAKSKEGNGVFSHKWCNHFVRKLNVNLTGSAQAIESNLGFPLNKVWGLDEKVGLKNYIRGLISMENYSPKDLFTIDEFSLFYCVPLDQIFDVSSVDKGLSQTSNFSDYIITIMLGCNMDGSEKLNPLVVSKHDTFDLSESTISAFHANPSYSQLSSHTLANKVSEAYQITYKYNNNKWITSSTFQDYLLTLDHKLESVTPGRKIIIFLDDSSTHRLMNLEFKNIKLVYLENASKHNNPYNGLFNEVKFDYIPTSFGIVEEFKIVFRLQQYLEMINKQNHQVATDHTSSPTSLPDNIVGRGSECGEILSEKDYQVPFIKAIEWIKRSWDSISKQKIYMAWKRANIVDATKPWPASDPIIRAEAAQTMLPLFDSLKIYDPHLAYEKLRNVMNYLNVVIPWELNELLGLVNERAKVSLNYASIDEMINSCASSEKNSDLISEQMNQSSVGQTEGGSSPALTQWTSQAREVGMSNDDSKSDLATQSRAETKAASLPNTGNLLASFQDKLPPITMAPSARQRNSPGYIGSPGNYSLSENRSSSMNALLLATNASSNADFVNTPSSDTSSPQRFEPASVPSVSKRFHDHITYGDMMADGEMNLKREEVSKRHKSSNNSSLGSVFSETGNAESISQTQAPLPGTSYKHPYSLLNSGPSLAASSLNKPANTLEEDLASTLMRVIDATKNNGIQLSDLALRELKLNLSKIQSKEKQSAWNGQNR